MDTLCVKLKLPRGRREGSSYRQHPRSARKQALGRIELQRETRLQITAHCELISELLRKPDHQSSIFLNLFAEVQKEAICHACLPNH